MAAVLLGMAAGPLRSALVWQLRQAGLEIDVTDTGAQTLNRLKTVPFDTLVVLDLPDGANAALIGYLADEPQTAERYRCLVCLDPDAPDLPAGIVQPPISILRRPLTVADFAAAVEQAAVRGDVGLPPPGEGLDAAADARP